MTLAFNKEFPDKYQDLIDYLANNQWQKANQHTELLHESPEVDELWVRFSNGLFGFSVQSRIWKEVGGYTVPSPEFYGASWESGDSDVADEKCDAFFERVGWSRYGLIREPNFSLSAPAGHLPWGDGRSLRSLSVRLSRFIDLDLSYT